MEPITTSLAAAAIISIKTWCIANGVSVGMPIILKIVAAFAAGGSKGAIDFAWSSSDVPSSLA